MKKLVSVLLTAAMILAMPILASAEDPDANVWIDRDAVSIEGTEVVVSVETDGNAAYGLLKVAYDETILSVEEADVAVADGVEMHSANVKDGKVLVSFISEQAVEKGKLLKVTFSLKNENASEEEIRQAVKAMNGGAWTAEADSETDDSLKLAIIEATVEEPSLAIIDGNNGEWDGEEGTDLSFTTNKEVTVREVKVNGEVLDPENYTVTVVDGKTVVTLTEDYLKSLPAGTYTLEIVSTDGETTTAQFVIAAQKADSSDKNGAAQTGDTTTYAIYLVMLAAAACCIGFAGKKCYDRRDAR